jgi:pyrrolysine biosynthesis protein PylD
MTRLTTDDLIKGPTDLQAYNQTLKSTTGTGLLELALQTTDLTAEELKKRAKALHSVAVLPLTMGQGIISGFAEQVAEIVRFLGMPSYVPHNCDVAGLGEVISTGTDILFCADDDTFFAMNLATRKIVDNGIATGQVYAAALVSAAGDMHGRKAAVIGLGPVGRAAAVWLHTQGIQVIVYDVDSHKEVHFLAQNPQITAADSIGNVLEQTNLVLDATNFPGIINIKDLKKHLIIAAPGMPLGIDIDDSHQVTLIHDPLQLGVAAMAVQVLA